MQSLSLLISCLIIKLSIILNNKILPSWSHPSLMTDDLDNILTEQIGDEQSDLQTGFLYHRPQLEKVHLQSNGHPNNCQSALLLLVPYVGGHQKRLDCRVRKFPEGNHLNHLDICYYTTLGIGLNLMLFMFI